MLRPVIDFENRLLKQFDLEAYERRLFLGLLLATELLDAAIPADVERRIQNDPRVSLLAAHVRRRLFPFYLSAGKCYELSFNDGQIIRLKMLNIAE